MSIEPLESAGRDKQERAGSEQDRWMPLLQATWLILAAATVLLFIGGIPALFAQLEKVCTAPVCFGMQLTARDAQALQRQGLTLAFYAVYGVALTTWFVLLFLMVSTLIMWRKRGDRAAVLTAVSLALFGIADEISALSTVENLPDTFWTLVVITALGLVFFMFPDGRFVPRWTRWAFIVVIALYLVSLQSTPASDGISGLVLLGFYLLGVGAQIHRYRRVSNTVQRLQTRWAVFGIVMAMLMFTALGMAGGFFPQLTTPSGSGWLSLVLDGLWPLAYTLIPFFIGIAILRSRLYDIDLIIRRTLIYAMLSVLLALVYLSSVVVLQELIRAVTGQTSDLAIVASTLLIAALCVPLRRRIQASIDRRFYRRKYDAVRVLEAFGATMREEVNLQQLTGELLAVVEQTLQPAHVGLWLRGPREAEKDRG